MLGRQRSLRSGASRLLPPRAAIPSKRRWKDGDMPDTQERKIEEPATTGQVAAAISNAIVKLTHE